MNRIPRSISFRHQSLPFELFYNSGNNFYNIHCTKNEVFLRIWSNLLKKSLMEHFIFCAVITYTYCILCSNWLRVHFEQCLNVFLVFLNFFLFVVVFSVLKLRIKMSQLMKWYGRPKIAGVTAVGLPKKKRKIWKQHVPIKKN